MNNSTEPDDVDGGLNWLLTSFARRVPDVAHALAVSVDGSDVTTRSGG